MTELGKFVQTSLLISAVFLAACDANSRPLSEAVEVRELNLQIILVLPPEDSQQEMF